MAYNYNNREYEERLNRVFSRHPNVNVGEMMHNERLGFQPHEKRLIEEEIRYGRPPQEHFSKTIANRGPEHMKHLHDMNCNHEDPRYRAFADDLAREFRF